eukprot:EG_transcript_14210
MKFAFDEINNVGGIMDQNITLVALEDAYNTTKTLENIVRLVDDEKVLALAGVIGSDVVLPARDFILQRQIPYVGAYSGIAALHTPFHREFVNVRMSFADEMVAHAMFLVQWRLVQRVACFYEDSAFGVGGYTALVAALANVGIQLVASGEYAKGTTDVASAVNAIAGANQPAQAVVLVGVEDALTSFIPLFSNDSRTDPACLFTAVSGSWGPAMTTALDTAYWGRIWPALTPAAAAGSRQRCIWTARDHGAPPRTVPSIPLGCPWQPGSFRLLLGAHPPSCPFALRSVWCSPFCAVCV